MDKLTNYLAKQWIKLDDSLDNLFKKRLLKTFNTTFLFLMSFIILVGIIPLVVPSSYPKSFKLYFFVSYISTGFVGLVITTTYLKRKAIKAKSLYPFVFKKLNLSLVDFDLLEFDENEKIEFDLLLNRRKVQNKINFKENSRSKSQANYRKLFSLFHVIVENGLEDIIDTQKSIFIDMLNESFLMNGDRLNLKTMDSSLSTWKGELKDSVSSANKYITDYKIIFSIKDN